MAATRRPLGQLDINRVNGVDRSGSMNGYGMSAGMKVGRQPGEFSLSPSPSDSKLARKVYMYAKQGFQQRTGLQVRALWRTLPRFPTTTRNSCPLCILLRSSSTRRPRLRRAGRKCFELFPIAQGNSCAFFSIRYLLYPSRRVVDCIFYIYILRTV